MIHTYVMVLNQCSIPSQKQLLPSGAQELLGDAEQITGKWTEDDKVGYRMYLNVFTQVIEPVRTSHR